MENFFSRYKNPLVLMAVLFIQVIALATQVKARSGASESPVLLRVWTVTAITPFERAFVSTGHFFRNTWRGYIDLRNVRHQNHDLQEEIGHLRLENARLRSDVDQNQRLRALLDFKEKYAGQTLAAQVIGSGGSEQSHVLYIDKGARNGIRQDMAVITPDGIVGKIKEVYPLSSQVLLINDRDSGAGVMLENSRLQGVLRGAELGELRVNDIMSDEKVDLGERVITSGGDRIYPKGLAVGTVTKVGQDTDTGTFLSIKVKPSADLNRLEEVLVITRMIEQSPVASDSQPTQRAADILAQRLPSIPKATSTPVKTASVKPPDNATTTTTPSQAASQVGTQKKPMALSSPAPGMPAGSSPAKNGGSKKAAPVESPAATPDSTPAAPEARTPDPEKPPR